MALVGERFDGHEFVADAAVRGAGGAVVSRDPEESADIPLYRVDDTLDALGALARHRRRAHPARVVGITGSSGKTTTKELTRAALATRYRVHANPGNLNNRVGLPLTLLAAPADAEVVVLEMGTNEPGEIGALTSVAEPELGVVTTVSESHLEKLGSLDGVLREKLALVEGLREGGHAVVGSDPPALAREARRRWPRVTVAGWEEDADVRPGEAEVDEEGRWRFRFEGAGVHMTIPGRHAVQNALLALVVARLLHVTPGDAARAVSGVEPVAMRSELRRVGGLTLLVDCYNANPQSVRAALDVLESLPEGRGKVVVLGTMLELGDRSEALHREVLADALERGLELVVATGAFARAARDMKESPTPARPPLLAVPDPREAYERLRERLVGDEVVLLKASRGVALESLVPLVEADFGVGSRDGGSSKGGV